MVFEAQSASGISKDKQSGDIVCLTVIGEAFGHGLGYCFASFYDGTVNSRASAFISEPNRL